MEHRSLRCSIPQAGTTVGTRNTSEVHTPATPKSSVLLTSQTPVYMMLTALISTAGSTCDLQLMLSASRTASFYTVYPGSLSTSTWAASGSTPTQSLSSLLPSMQRGQRFSAWQGRDSVPDTAQKENPGSE